VSNLFGSLTLLFDRPFQIGDWIQIGSVDGSVESVGMRSTRVRTFYNSLITIPNSELTTATIDNYGARQYRRFKTDIGVQYDTTPEQIEAFCEGIRELIRRHPYTRKDYYHVYLNTFGASSLNILLYCFLDTPEWSTELRERERLMLDIMKLARELGVQFAFPTQTLHMFKEEATDGVTVEGDSAQVGIQKARSVLSAGDGTQLRKPPPVEIKVPEPLEQASQDEEN
jgi:MscS family membrane protein